MQKRGVGAVLKQFQFHSGSIKRNAQRIGTPSRCEFQFHSGSIKRASSSPHSSSGSVFQFHSGSIKSAIYAKELRERGEVSIP